MFDCREEPFRLPGVQPSSQGQPEPRKPAKAKEEATAASSAPPSRPSMAAILTDCDPKAIYATVNKEPRDPGAGAASGVRMRPPGDLKLARSLSKSDSDLLVSPPSEEEGGLGNRSESVSNCSTGKKRLEKSPSFTSEWDEVSVGYSSYLSQTSVCMLSNRLHNIKPKKILFCTCFSGHVSHMKVSQVRWTYLKAFKCPQSIHYFNNKT